MLSRRSAAFRADPLRFLERAFGAEGDTLRLPGGAICVADPVAARAVLHNADGMYLEHSDFFATDAGTFGPRPAQVVIARSARELLKRHMAVAADSLPDRVTQMLAPGAAWPDAGNRVLFEHFGPVLLHPGSPAPLRAALGLIVEQSVLAGARERGSRRERARYRAAVMRELTAAIRDRRAGAATAPADLLDVVSAAAHLGDGVSDTQLAEVYLGFVFAIVGSVGFALGWSVYLLALADGGAGSPVGDLSWVVREALRLWPVAWFFGRRPARSHQVAGVQVTPADEVVVCSYLVHRHPRYWSRPEDFWPARWADAADHPAYQPFGWGPHSCAGAAVATAMVVDVLHILLGRYRLVMTGGDARPFMTASLAPPPFWLRLVE